MTIRNAKVEDARKIAELHIEGWRRAYDGIFPEDVLKELDVTDWTTWWSDMLQQSQVITKIVVSEYGTIVGVVSGGPLRDSFISGYDGELYAIYLAPEVQGTGLGRKLFLSMAGQLQEYGFTSMIVWLAVKNETRYFYEKYGPVEVKRVINQYGVEDAAYGYTLQNLTDIERT
ncbi:GNAT family N-acetyltransferase [Salibacterium qingdaonense]|uniref:Ribosomal protein S18 acetylase RimI n=1 Tax=Salibacterium qingdaonense TaxID=266892 RepID=A0A1I4HZ13_9BACI|nr:GNAT family N-acetyltransferase [Salibacterium qingdaonense]SFL47067.1 Ribosomal protein S18 acetylase RimI [Salibacterium qingdaonense]